MSLPDLSLPNVDSALFDPPTGSRFAGAGASTQSPPFLLLYGSLRERSYSKLLTLEAARLLIAMGGEVRVFDPAGLSLPDSAPETHPRVQELREAAAWAEGMVWTSPERHGAMTGIMKAQIDWIPLNFGAVRPTQGKTLAVMEVFGDSQSFNAVNQLRVLGRWMRMITIPNQSSVAKAFLEFDDAGRMKPSAYYERVVDVMEELVKFKPQALPVCDRSAHCGDDNPPFHADQPFQLSLTTCRFRPPGHIDLAQIPVATRAASSTTSHHFGDCLGQPVCPLSLAANSRLRPLGEVRRQDFAVAKLPAHPRRDPRTPRLRETPSERFFVETP